MQARGALKTVALVSEAVRESSRHRLNNAELSVPTVVLMLPSSW